MAIRINVILQQWPTCGRFLYVLFSSTINCRFLHLKATSLHFVTATAPAASTTSSSLASKPTSPSSWTGGADFPGTGAFSLILVCLLEMLLILDQNDWIRKWWACNTRVASGLFHVELLHKGTGLEFRNSLVSRKFIPAVSSWMPLILKFLMQLQFQDNKQNWGVDLCSKVTLISLIELLIGFHQNKWLGSLNDKKWKCKISRNPFSGTESR